MSSLPELVPVEKALGSVSAIPDLYCAVQEPTRIAGMSYPGDGTDWTALGQAGFELVLCLTDDQPGYDPAPLRALGVELEDLFGERAPTDPEGQRRRIAQAARIISDAYRDGVGVVVHCVGGRGRSGTVLGAALVSFGFEPSTVACWLDALHQERSGLGWPESRFQRDVLNVFGEVS